MSEASSKDTSGVHSKVYSGIWGIISRLMKVPREAPSLPTRAGEFYQELKPSRGFLNHLRVKFAIGAIFATIGAIAGAIGLFQIDVPFLGFLSLPIITVLEFVGLFFAFVAVHLRYDTIWYVMNDRSIRIRRGLWLIRESTITFENVQNVKVSQGPIQRMFGISNVLIETAGGGGTASPHGDGNMNAHHGLIEGVDDPHRIREMILARLRKSKSSGLGDEHEDELAISSQEKFSPTQVALLREIRDLARAAAQAT